MRPLTFHRLDERWGAETSAKGTRFKLNRDMAGYFLTGRADIAIEDLEPKVNITIPNPAKLRTLGDLVHFDKVTFKFPKAPKALLEDVTFTVEQGGRCAFIGAVSTTALLTVWCRLLIVVRLRMAMVNPHSRN